MLAESRKRNRKRILIELDQKFPLSPTSQYQLVTNLPKIGFTAEERIALVHSTPQAQNANEFINLLAQQPRCDGAQLLRRRAGEGLVARLSSAALDTLTHALSGALLARATAPKDAPPRSLPRRIAAGFFACAAPDLDFVIGFVGPVEYLLSHRGVTHSRAPAAGLGAALFLDPGEDAARAARRLARALRRHRARASRAHIAGDLITSFGTIIFAPLSDWRAAHRHHLHHRPVVQRHHRRRPGVFAVFFDSTHARGGGERRARRLRRLPVRAEAARDWSSALEYAQIHGLRDARVTVHPRPVSPFNWTVFVSDDEAHRFAHVNLVRKEPRRYRRATASSRASTRRTCRSSRRSG